MVPTEDAEALYELAPCGYLSYAPDGTLVRVNQTFLEWTGYSREDLVGVRRFVDLLTPGGRIYHETHYAPLLRMQHSVSEIALTIVTATGRRLPVLVNSRMLVSEDGEERVTLTSVFNATDRRRYEQELMLARRHAEDARERVRLMQAVAAELTAADDVAAVSRVLTGAATASLHAAASVLWLRSEPHGVLVAAAADGVPTDGETVLDLPLSEAAASDGSLRRGEVVAVPADEARARFPLASAALQVRGRCVFVLAPLMAHGRQLGVIALRFPQRDELEPPELELVQALAGQGALAVPRARLFEQQRDIAQTLQRSLLPARLPSDPRVSLASVYRPAHNGPAVGGDWYDAFWLDGDRLAVVVGDVVGRGVNASAAMGQLRSALRAVASVSPDPAAVLEALDRFVEDVPAASSATVVYAVLDVSTRVLRYACAGHPPPVLSSPGDATRLLWDGRSVPLGVRLGGEHRGVGEVRLPRGARLVLYTDGLVERRDAPLDVRMEQLALEVAARAGLPPEAMVEAVADTMLQDLRAPDDVCLLCVSPGADDVSS